MVGVRDGRVEENVDGIFAGKINVFGDNNTAGISADGKEEEIMVGSFVGKYDGLVVGLIVGFPTGFIDGNVEFCCSSSLKTRLAKSFNASNVALTLLHKYSWGELFVSSADTSIMERL